MLHVHFYLCFLGTMLDKSGLTVLISRKYHSHVGYEHYMLYNSLFVMFPVSF